uniref:Ig-like domain-containing protein n=1 Tax=Moschus moschiferus TaxID=68415 RepID=A0A8C6E0E8_MOSMO
MHTHTLSHTHTHTHTHTPRLREEETCSGPRAPFSLLTFWTPPTTARLTVETVPPLAAEGNDVLLLACNVPENPLGYAWHRGERVDNSQLIASYRVDTNVTAKGPAHSNRETVYPNGTLLIQNITQKDTGFHTLLVSKVDLETEGQTGHLYSLPAEPPGKPKNIRVGSISLLPQIFLIQESNRGLPHCENPRYKRGNVLSVTCTAVLPTPVITSNNSRPWEHKDTVVLTCGAETRNTSYTWWINNQSLPNSTRLELSEDKRTLTVFTVTRNDTGPYVCEARNPVSVSRSDPFTLNVLYGPDTPITSHQAPVTIQRQTSAFPTTPPLTPATLCPWLITRRPPQSIQELFIPNITADKSRSYNCLVRNFITGLSKTTVKAITVSGKWPLAHQYQDLW